MVSVALEMPAFFPFGPVLDEVALPRRFRHGLGVESLEERAARGDRDALSTLLRQHAEAVYQLCYHVIGPAEASDMAQRALERIVTHIQGYDPARGAFRSWALTIARNACRDQQRRRGVERAAFVADGDERTDQAPAALPNPEELAAVRADARRLSAAMQDLPESMRSAVVMFHVHGASYEELAAALSVPVGTVMTWLHRGRARLRDALSRSDVTGGAA
jgi:RNA polymerase sigma-70 factor (ECF subfamily)